MSGLWSGGSIPDRVSRQLLVAPNSGSRVRERLERWGPFRSLISGGESPMIRASASRGPGSGLGIVFLHRDSLCVKSREIFFTPEISTHSSQNTPCFRLFSVFSTSDKDLVTRYISLLTVRVRDKQQLTLACLCRGVTGGQGRARRSSPPLARRGRLCPAPTIGGCAGTNTRVAQKQPETWLLCRSFM